MSSYFQVQVKYLSGTIKPYVGPLIDQGINTSRDKLDEDFFHKEVQVEIPIQERSSKISQINPSPGSFQKIDPSEKYRLESDQEF